MDLSDLFADRVAVRDPDRPPVAPLPVAVVTMELQRGVIGDVASHPELAAVVAASGVVAATARLLDHARTTSSRAPTPPRSSRSWARCRVTS